MVHKLENIKEYEAELKQILSIDKKYSPIQKQLVGLLRGLNPFLQSISQKDQRISDLFIQKSLKINRQYAENMENFHRSLDVLIRKNQDEIDNSQKIKNTKTHELNLNLKLQLEQIEEKVSQIEVEAKEKLEKADQTLKRELAQIQKVMVEARKVYQETTQNIELEKKESTELFAKRYDDKIKQYQTEETAFRQDIEERRAIIREDGQKATQVNDESYLTIKNTYSQLSISLNKKINELKKKYQAALTVLEKEHQERLKPILLAIEELKLSYQEAQKKALQSYTEKMSSLNVIFDVQKSSYESKKERIIHEGNDQITLLNSKLSAYRETTQKEKLNKSREIRDEIKSLEDENDRDKKNRDLTQMLNSFDAELNKQIIRTNKDIIQKKKDAQRKLYELDQKHLREINEWRQKKVLYEYEKKQDFAKIDLNFNHNIQASELMQKSEELTHAYQKEILLQQHNFDLLPLEYQLSIGAAIQERELNLLANDAHVTIATFKHSEALLDFELKKELATLDHKRDQEKTHYEADLRVLNASTQLELEKEKLKRDFILSEQELRIELSNVLFNKQKQSIEYELKNQINEIDLDRELVYLSNKQTLDQLKQEALSEEVKRTFIVNEGKYKHQQRMSNEKATRLLRTYQNELENNQMLIESFFQIIYMFYQTDRTIKDALIELYHLPSHPEVFKGIIDFIKRYSVQLLASLFNIVEEYQRFDQEFYIKKIEDLTGYKYMLKHEDMMNYYDQEAQKVKDKIALIESDIKGLEEQFFINQAEIERVTLHMTQLERQIDTLKMQTKSEHKHQDLKELLKEVSNKEHEIKRLKQLLTRIEKSMDQKHMQITPLDEEIKKILAKQKKEEDSLAKSKHQEASVFYKYLAKNKHIYETLTQDIKVYHETLMNFYHALHNEVYVSDLFLNEKMKGLMTCLNTFEKKVTERHQQFMNLMLLFYQKNHREQQVLTLGFRKSMTELIRSLNNGYARQLDDIKSDQQRRENEYRQQEKTLRVKMKKKVELEAISYKKALYQDQNLLKVLETKLSDNSSRRDTELKLIHENQLASAQQYEHEHQIKLNELKAQFDKGMFGIEQTILNAVKNHTSIDESITNKNEAILLKYQTNHDKSMMTFKQKSVHIEETIEKNKKNQTERLLQEEHLLKRMNVRRENELKNIAEHMTRFTRQTKRQQNHVLYKELRLLRKTHFSKVKMLHLN